MWAMIGLAILALGADKPPLRVFILAGQSNMEGQAVVDLAGRDYNQGKEPWPGSWRTPKKRN